jgi:hypothetical protein
MWLDIGGNLVVDGVVSSRGLTTKWGPGTGGSILVYAHGVTGSGVISANGGAGIVLGTGDNDGGGGGGGRVAVYTDVPVELPSSSIVALGGYAQSTDNANNARRAGTAGSVYLALKSAPHAGTLRINNENSPAEWRRTLMPGIVATFGGVTVTPVEDFNKVDLFIEKRGNPQLSSDVFFNSVRLGESTNNELELLLAGNTLTVREFYPKGDARKLRSGTHVKVAGIANLDLPGFALADAGTVIVLPTSTLFMVR